MNKNKIIFQAFCLVLSAVLASTTAYAQGIPVLDAKAVKDRAANQLETIEKWGSQYKQMSEQISQFKTNAIGSLLGVVTTTGGDVGKQGHSDYAGNFTQAANKYLGESANQCAKSGSGNNPNYQACMAQRNMKAATLQEMNTLLNSVDKRSSEIDSLVQRASTGKKTPGEMQAFQFQISAIQAQIQNDFSRMNLSLAIYKQREDLYRQQQRDSARSLMTGGTDAISLKDALKTIQH